MLEPRPVSHLCVMRGFGLNWAIAREPATFWVEFVDALGQVWGLGAPRARPFAAIVVSTMAPATVDADAVPLGRMPLIQACFRWLAACHMVAGGTRGRGRRARGAPQALDAALLPRRLPLGQKPPLDPASRRRKPTKRPLMTSLYMASATASPLPRNPAPSDCRRCAPMAPLTLRTRGGTGALGG